MVSTSRIRRWSRRRVSRPSNRLDTPLSRTVVGLLEFYNVYDQTRRRRVGAPLHDPCVIAYLLQPELFRGRKCHVAIETKGEHTLGRTVVDWSGRTPRPPNATVIHEIDADGFFALLTERLGRLPLAPPKAVNPGRGDERLPSILDTHSGVADDWRAAGQRTCGLTWRYAPSLDHLCLPCG